MSAGQVVAIFGIRHHGPGSARSLLAALEEFAPDEVLIEGPADADPILPLAGSGDLEPPVALLAYAPDEPRVSAFWPFAVFSPEWQALTWALRHDVRVAMCDLPAAQVLATGPRSARHRSPERADPLGVLAAAAGYDDAERWWEDMVEARLDGSSPFAELADAMGELRAVYVDSEIDGDDPVEARREAYMRARIRTAQRAGRERVAVVCGAWHAPVLRPPLGTAVADAGVLRGGARRNVSLTWVPWTHARLAYTSGYGAGITSPGWYHHLWTTPDRTIVRWMTSVAGALRARDLAVSSAHVIEAVRLAETLAGIRGRPLAGLGEVTDATRAVLCGGDEIAVRYVTDTLVVGQRLGQVSERVPTVPLEADLVAASRTLRLKREPNLRLHELDLRRAVDQARSVLFHRLQLLGIGWVRSAADPVAGRGTFRETWHSRWTPELSLDVLEAAVWGTTVATAAAARVEDACTAGTLAELTALLTGCLRADLGESLDHLLGALAVRAARESDVDQLMAALPDLARAVRYGDVRGSDTAVLQGVAEQLLLRICAGLSRALSGLDDDAARAARGRIDAVNVAVTQLEAARAGRGPAEKVEHGLTEHWLSALADLIDRQDLNGQVSGRLVRLCFDAGRLAQPAQHVQRALSRAVPAGQKAAWVDGFFAGGGVLLAHDPTLRGLLDEWVSGLDAGTFPAVLPLVRRTFSTFSPAERRGIAERIAATAGPDADHAGTACPTGIVDPAAEATVRLLLGWPA